MDARQFISKIPGTPRLWLMLFVAFSLVFGFFEIVDDVFNDPLEADYESHELDVAIANFFQQFRTQHLTQMAIDLTALGSASIIALFAIIGLTVTFGKRDYLGSLHMSTALLGAVVWPLLLKSHFGRNRPDLVEHLVNVSDLSFPSGHSFGAATAYATFAYFGARYVRHLTTEILCYLFALAIVIIVGITRVYLGVHYASDVMAGLSAGGAWAFFVAAGYSILYQRQKNIIVKH